MSPDEFLVLALSLPETATGSHPGGADIRVAGKIFTSPADRPGGAAVLKLTLEQRMVRNALRRATIPRTKTQPEGPSSND